MFGSPALSNNFKEKKGFRTPGTPTFHQLCYRYLPQVILEFHDHILAHKGFEKGIEELLEEREGGVTIT